MRTFHRKVWQEWEYSQSSPVIYFYPLAAASFKTSAPTEKGGRRNVRDGLGGGGGRMGGLPPTQLFMVGKMADEKTKKKSMAMKRGQKGKMAGNQCCVLAKVKSFPDSAAERK